MLDDQLIVIHFDEGGYLHREYPKTGKKMTRQIQEARHFPSEQHALRMIEGLDLQGALFPEHDPALQNVTVDIVQVSLVKRIVP